MRRISDSPAAPIGRRRRRLTVATAPASLLSVRMSG